MEKSNKPIIKYIQDFLDYLDIEKGLSDKTQENYARFLNKFSEWLERNNISGLEPHQLDKSHIWKYRVYLARYTSKKSKKPLKKSTQNYYLIALRALLNYFANRDIFSLPAEKIELAKSESKRTIKYLNLEQVEKLFLAPDTATKTGLRDRAILETLFSTAMRVAGLVSLNREQMPIKHDTTDLEITIIGKGDRPRPIFFSERAIHWLRKYLNSRIDTDEALFIRYGGPKSASKRLTSRSIENIVKKYSKIAGLPFVATPHTIRHSTATDLLNQGADLRSVQEFLGHKSISTTQIYTHVTNRRLRDIHRKFHSGKKLKG